MKEVERVRRICGDGGGERVLRELTGGGEGRRWGCVVGWFGGAKEVGRWRVSIYGKSTPRVKNKL